MPRQHWKLPFLLPPGFDAGGNVHFSWTVAFAPGVDHSSPDEYTLAGLDVQFRPHADKVSFSPPNGAGLSSITVDVQRDAARAKQLLDEGWKPSPVPVSDSSKGQGERELRAAMSKWETLVRGERKKRASSVSEPMLTLSIIGRGEWDSPDPKLQARYAAVLTADAPNYRGGDLYAQVLQNFTRLKPITLQQRVPGHVRLPTAKK
jgi:hypothetical protein